MSVEQEFITDFKSLLEKYDVTLDVVLDYDFVNNPHNHCLGKRVEIISRGDKINFFIPDFISYVTEKIK